MANPVLVTDRVGGPSAGPIVMGPLVRAANLSDQVVLELESLIVANRIAVGETLPSERDLATQFGVSRTVIREALRVLLAKSLIDVSNGRGTVVRELTPESAAESIKLLMRVQPGGMELGKVLEVRRLLEVHIAELAAERRTPPDLSALRYALDVAAERLGEPKAFVQADIDFHMGLARATQNELFPLILDALSSVLIDVRLIALRVPGTPERALAHHHAVFAAVGSGDSAGARRAMNAHMDEARDTLASAETTVEDPSS